MKLERRQEQVRLQRRQEVRQEVLRQEGQVGQAPAPPPPLPPVRRVAEGARLQCPVVAALLHLCCSSVAALLQLCCISVAALLHLSLSQKVRDYNARADSIVQDLPYPHLF